MFGDFFSKQKNQYSLHPLLGQALIVLIMKIAFIYLEDTLERVAHILMISANLTK